MKLVINGEEKTIGADGELSVERLISELGMTGAPCAVEVNRQVVPKRRHAEHRLGEGDQVEIVSLVGGG